MGAEAIGSASGEDVSVLAEVFGLDGFDVLAAADAAGELEIMIEMLSMNAKSSARITSSATRCIWKYQK